jgi:hypothetical protein
MECVDIVVIVERGVSDLESLGDRLIEQAGRRNAGRSRRKAIEYAAAHR